MSKIYIVLIVLFLSGCDSNIFDSKNDVEHQKRALQKEKDIAMKKLSDKLKMELAILNSKKELATLEYKREIELKKIESSSKKEMAKFESKKELLLIEKNQELAKIRMKVELEKQKSVLEQEKKEALFQQKMQQIDQINNMELKRYLMIILALLVVISSFFIFYYFKKRREDKLLAYNDNLEKYFRQKENDTRVRIAEKLLDTISSGNLDKEQENQLIGVLSGEKDVPMIEKKEEKYDEIELIAEVNPKD